MYKDSFPDEIDEISSCIFEQLTEKLSQPKTAKPFIMILRSPSTTESNWFYEKWKNLLK